MKIDKKIALAASLGLLALVLIIFFENFTKTYFLHNNEILNRLHKLEREEIRLDYEVLQGSMFLYKNLDTISKIYESMEKSLNELLDEKTHLNSEHPTVYKMLIQYKKSLSEKIENIQDFESLNATIKNSAMFLADLLKKSTARLDKEAQEDYIEYEKNVAEAISSIFLAKNSFDEDFLKSVKKNYENLKKYRFKDRSTALLHQNIMAHLKLFIEKFPLYTRYLDSILKSKSKFILNRTINMFLKSANEELKVISLLYIALILFYFGAIFYIIYLLYLMDRENSRLKRYQKRLEVMARLDPLTGLYNRRVLERDKRRSSDPAFIIVNINGFKHFNDFYGINIGDKILKKTARILKKIVPEHLNASFYRIGGDDFGILINNCDYPLEKLAQRITNHFKNSSIKIGSIEINLTVSLGITKKYPLVETADMALKHIKRDIRRSYFIYNEKLGFFEKTEENIKKAAVLKKALQRDHIKLYLQPIVDTRSESEVKYEVLTYIKNEKEDYESIYKYLQIAKDIKLYESLTYAIFKKSFELFDGLDKEFSLNISVEDISNPHILKFMGSLYKNHSRTFKNVTFEILESAAINDYDAVRDFISIIKRLGSKVAIDDFGSGYSNFEHILNLNVDYIKIDGSLIKNLDRNENARLIVKTIVSFAKEAGIKTIAEYVRSGSILNEVRKLGIDYAQGELFAMPEPAGRERWNKN